MKILRKILFFAALSAVSAQAWAEPLIRVGLTQGGHEEEHIRIFDATRKALEDRFGKDNVSFDVIHVNSLVPKIKSGEVNFFISTAGLGYRMLAEGSKDLLTMTSERFPDPNHSFGAVFVTRWDFPGNSIGDLKGTSFVGNRPMGFYGYVVPMGEIAKQGFDPQKFFSSQTFLDSGSFDVLKAVEDGKAAVGTVPSCFLEDNFPKDDPVFQKLKPIGVKAAAPCVRSTDDYPNWAISSSPGTSPELSREVVRVLLNVPKDASGYQWSIGTDFTTTDTLYRNLKTGAYEMLQSWDLEGFLKEYRPWLLAGLFLLIALSAYSLLLNFLVRKRTRQLADSFVKQIRLQEKYRKAEERFESQQKLGLIGQMSSMMAHELRQPLSTMQAYVQGLRLLAQKGSLEAGKAAELLLKVEEQAKKVDAIVQSVRNYAKEKKTKMDLLPLQPVIKHALKAYEASGRFSGKISVSLPEKEIRALINPMEIELSVLNLLRNAGDELSQAEIPHPEISLDLREEPDAIYIEVKDNGPVMDDERFAMLSLPLKSTKAQGLGIGLSLVRTIAENHGGKLIFTRIPTGGLAAILKLPRREK